MEGSLSHLHFRPSYTPLLHGTISQTKLPSLQNPRIRLAVPSAMRSRLRNSWVYSSRSWLLPKSSRRPLTFPPTQASKRQAGLADGVDGRIFVGSGVTVLFAVLNRVLYKLALVPMKNYPFFLAQVTTFG